MKGNFHVRLLEGLKTGNSFSLLGRFNSYSAHRDGDVQRRQQLRAKKFCPHTRGPASDLFDADDPDCCASHSLGQPNRPPYGQREQQRYRGRRRDDLPGWRKHNRIGADQFEPDSLFRYRVVGLRSPLFIGKV